jgi:hypothetical protein
MSFGLAPASPGEDRAPAAGEGRPGAGEVIAHHVHALQESGVLRIHGFASRVSGRAPDALVWELGEVG